MARTYQRRSAEQWQQLINEQAESGLGIAAFCKQHQISTSNFYQWRSRYQKSTGAAAVSPSKEKSSVADFVSIPLPVENVQASSIPPTSDMEVTLSLPGGISLSIRTR